MFETALKEYGRGGCSISGESLIIGVGAQEPLGGVVDIVPREPQKVFFLNGPEQVDLIRAFSKSTAAEKVQHLSLGSSHLVAEQKGSLDFTEAVSALSGSAFPALKTMSLGDMERLFNGHCYYGRLGDLAPIFSCAPKLQSLEVYGHFSLSAPVQHDYLIDLSAIVDEIGVTGGPPSQASIDHLLESRFAKMKRIELWLDVGSDDLKFSVPNTFIAGSGMPKLETFAMDRVREDTLTKIRQWASQRAIRLHLE